jgi:signal transduction histidine kinase
MNLGTAEKLARPSYKLLLVEDNPGDEFFVKTLLGKSSLARFELISVAYLEEAKKYLQKGTLPHVILLDLHLPDSAGEETFHSIQAVAPQTPTIILTGLSEGEIAVGLLEQGAFAFLRKDEITESVLFNAIYSCLKRHEKENELRLLKEEAERNNQEKSRFLGFLSHELRTPLTSISGFARLLNQSASLSPEELSHLLRIESNAEHLEALVNSLLDLSKIEAGHLDIAMANVDIVNLLDDVFHTLKVHAEKKGITLTCLSLNAIPRIISTDRIRLKQVLLNLIGNGVKYSDVGKVEVLVEYLDKNATLKFLIRDQGRGISEENQGELFKPYRRLSSNDVSGTGLGLVLSRKLARALGGEVLLESSSAKGSTFSVSIRCLLPENENSRLIYRWPSAKSIVPPRHSEPQAAVLQGKRFLIVDDVEDIRTLFSWVLKKSGATEIDFASTIEQATQKALERPYDAILLDLSLGDADGSVVAKQLREKGYGHPIIALTAHTLPEYRERALAAGANLFLTKPIQFSELIHTLVSLS